MSEFHYGYEVNFFPWPAGEGAPAMGIWAATKGDVGINEIFDIPQEATSDELADLLKNRLEILLARIDGTEESKCSTK